MKWLNGYRVSLAVIGCVSAVVFSGDIAEADFTFGEPVNLGSTVNSWLGMDGPQSHRMVWNSTSARSVPAGLVIMTCTLRLGLVPMTLGENRSILGRRSTPQFAKAGRNSPPMTCRFSSNRIAQEEVAGRTCMS